MPSFPFDKTDYQIVATNTEIFNFDVWSLESRSEIQASYLSEPSVVVRLRWGRDSTQISCDASLGEVNLVISHTAQLSISGSAEVGLKQIKMEKIWKMIS